MSVDVFKIKGKVELDTEDFVEDVDNAVDKGKELHKVLSGNGRSESWLTTFSSGLNVVKTVGGAAVNTIQGLASAGLSLVETAASMKALDEGLTASFANMGNAANEAFARVGDANNIAVRRLQESGLGFFRQFTSAGMDEAEALEKMELALGYAADAAAAYDISIEEASSMMRSFVRGNVEAGEAIGLFVTQAKRDELAGTMFDGAKWEDLTEAQRQYLLLDVAGQAYKDSKVLGQGAREAENWTNVVGNLASAWKDAQAIMGEEIMIALTPALQDLTKWIEDNPEIFESLGEIFGEVATALVDAFKSLLTFIDEHGDDITAFLEKLEKVFSGEMSIWSLFSKEPRTNWEEISGADLHTDLSAAAALMGGTYDGDSLPVPVHAVSDDGGSGLQNELNNAGLTAPVEYQWWNPLSWFGSTPNAKGLEYVPYDNYVTRLHRGESILNRVEAEDWRSAQRGGNMGADPAAIGAAVKAALAGVSITMDGRSVGTLVTPYVSKEQYRETWKRR